MKRQSTAASVISAGLLLATVASADPYNPGERALGGGLIGAGTGAVIGAIAGGGRCSRRRLGCHSRGCLYTIAPTPPLSPPYRRPSSLLTRTGSGCIRRDAAVRIARRRHP